MDEETKPTSSPADGEPGRPSIIATATPPPAGKIVVTAERTEREVNLEAELAAERASHANTAAEKKQREFRVAELEDQLDQLKHPTRAARSDSTKDSWWFNP